MESVSPRVTLGSNLEELADCFPTPFYIPTITSMVPNSPHPLWGYESWFLDFQGGDITYASHINKLWVTFPITAHKPEKTKGKIFPDLANALRVKTTSPSEILPTFIFWPKHLFSWYCTYGSFLYLTYYFYLLSLDKQALKPGQPC